MDLDRGMPMRGVLSLVAALAVAAALWMVLGIAGEPGSEPQATSPTQGAAQPEVLASRPVLEGSSQREAATDEARAALAAGYPTVDPFRPPGALEGVVVDANDQPLTGITVHVDGLQDSATALSDDAGRFARAGLVPGDRVWVWAAERGLVRAGVTFGQHFFVRPGGTEDVRIRLVRGLALHGRVVHADGTPAQGAKIGLHRLGRSSVHPDFLRTLVVESDSDGSFRLDGVPLLAQSTGLFVHARLRGYPRAEASLETMNRGGEEVPRDAAEPIELVLAEPCHVDVRVLSEETGEGIEGAAIATGPPGRNHLGRTGPDGRCHVGPVAPGPLTITAHASSWGTAQDSTLLSVVATPDHVPNLTLRMFRTYEITGRVVYAGGEPANDRSLGLAMSGESQSSSTEILETFRLVDLRPGTYRIAVSSHDMDKAKVDATDGSVLGRATLEAGTKDAVIALDIPRPVPLEVRVTTGDGQPLDHGLIRIGSDAERWRVNAVEDAPRVKDGRATVAGFLQPIWIDVLPLPTAPWAPVRTGPVAPGTRHLDIRLEPAHSLSGHAIGPDGPVAGVTISMDPNAEAIDCRRFGCVDDGSVTTAEDGAFVFPRLRGGSYWMHVTPPEGYAPIEGREVTASDEDLVVQLRRLASIALPILDADGVALVDAEVKLWRPPWFADSSAICATTDASGVAHLDAVDPEVRYALEVEPPATAPTSRRYWQSQWAPDEASVRLEGAWHVRGRVQNADGSSAAHAMVSLLRPGDEPIDALRADGAGRFELLHVEPEGCTLWANARAGHAQSPRVPVAGSSADVVLTLEAHAGRLEVRTHDWPRVAEGVEAFEAPAHFAVWSPGDPRRTLRGRPGPEGEVVLEGLDPSVPWSVCVTRKDQDLCARLDDLSADGQAHTMEPRPAQPIRGHVLLPDGAYPLTVEVLETGLVYEILDDGTYTVTGHPPGTWTLRLAAGHRRATGYRTVTVHDGEVPVVDFRTSR
ncbi:MAG: carboxypeptidase-like regulatory domain-containing protein [Planctomycetota bacterium]